jgi:hypothetical protein
MPVIPLLLPPLLLRPPPPHLVGIFHK